MSSPPTTPRGDDDMLLNVYRDLMTGALVLVRNWFTNEPYCAQAEQLASQAICRAIAPRSETEAPYNPDDYDMRGEVPILKSSTDKEESQAGVKYATDFFKDHGYYPSLVQAFDAGRTVVRSAVARREGHSALRVRDGQLERFDPHPPAEDVKAAAVAWERSCQVQPPPNSYEGFLAGASWARSASGRSLSEREVENIANADRFNRAHFEDDTAFADWAQNRCRSLLRRIADSGSAK